MSLTDKNSVVKQSDVRGQTKCSSSYSGPLKNVRQKEVNKTALC